MTDTHFELMNTLQNQRDQLALLVTLLAHDEYKALRTEAVDTLDSTCDTIQFGMDPHYAPHTRILVDMIALNTALIETLNAAWRESEAAL